MKKFLLMLAIMGSVVTTASAKQEQQPKDEFVIVIFKGWCGKAHISATFDHEPTWWDSFLYEFAANSHCDELLKAGLL